MVSYTWSNKNGGVFGDAGNWTPDGIPGSGDSATFDVGGAYTVTGNGTVGYALVDDKVTFTGTITADQVTGQFTAFEVGSGGAVVFDGGSLDSAAEGRIGNAGGSGSLSFIDGATGIFTATSSATALDVAFADQSGISTTGTVTVDGDGSALTLMGAAYIGTDGAGTLDISNGGLVHVAEIADATYSSFEVGQGTGATGLVDVTSGSTLTVDIYTVIGDAGQGAIDFSDGATGSFTGSYYDGTLGADAPSYALYLGGNGGSGTLSVDGAGTSVTTDEGALIGQYGNGVVSVTNGASLTFGASNSAFSITYVGADTGATGSVTVSGGAVLTDLGVLDVGTAGTGHIDIESGGTVYSNAGAGDVSGEVGSNPGGTGIGTIADGLWDAQQAFSVGYQGNGTLTIDAAGTLEVGAGFLRVARDPGATGTLTVDGGQVLASAVTLTVGAAATDTGDGTGGFGLLQIENAGTVTVDNAIMGDLIGGTGSIDVNGAFLSIGGSFSTGAGSSTVTVENSGVVNVTGAADIGGGGGTALVELTNFGGLFDYGSGVTLEALGTLALDADAYLDTANGTTDAPLVLDGGTLDVLGDGSLRDPLALSITGGTTAAPSAIVGGVGSDVQITGGITFATAGSVLLLGQGYDTGNAINSFGAGDTLDVRIAAGDVFSSAAYNTATGTLTLSDTSGDSLSLHVVDNGYGLDPLFQAMADGAGGTYVSLENNAPCFCLGTLILTDRGDVPVETLEIGDVVVTAAGQNRPIKWIGRRSLNAQFVRGNAEVIPVRLQAGSLGGGLPRRDLYVSPEHAMFIDGMLIPAKLLTNGVSITQDWDREVVAYFHIELDTHDVIFAEGAPTETYLEEFNRGMFHNLAEYHALYPDEPRRDQPLFCAPRLEDGEELEKVRQDLAGLVRLAA